jgi:uncharacterized membrane protein
MRAVVDFLKTSIVGGALFLLPIVVTLVLLKHALDAVQGPIGVLLAGTGLTHVAGIALAGFVAIAALLVLCFVAGLVAKTSAGTAAVQWLEESLLGRVPMYQMLKSATADVAGIVGQGEVEVVLREADGGWQLAFVMERFDDGWYTLLVPEAPSAISGSILYVRGETLHPANVTVAQAMNVVKRGGLGSGALLRAHLGSPAREAAGAAARP